MKKVCLFLILALIASGILCPENLQAQSDEERYFYGVVVSASSDRITAREDSEEDENQNREFDIVSTTELYELDAVEELQEGDWVDIYYIEEDGQLKATYVEKETEDEDDSWEADDDDDDMIDDTEEDAQ